MFNGAEASAALDQYRLLQSPVALKFGDEYLQFFFRQVRRSPWGRSGRPRGIRHIRREASPPAPSFPLAT